MNAKNIQLTVLDQIGLKQGIETIDRGLLSYVVGDEREKFMSLQAVIKRVLAKNDVEDMYLTEGDVKAA